MGVCSVDDCDRVHYAKTFCKLHYNRAAKGLEHNPCLTCGGPTAKAGDKHCGRSCRMKWHRKFGCYRDEVALVTRGTCSVTDCSNPVHANGMCRAHDLKMKRYGNPSVDNRRLFGSPTCVTCGADRQGKGGKNLCHRCYHNAYYHENVEAERARKNSRRSYLKRVTPAWADREAIREFYANCPTGHEVDHIIPVQGKHVTGLHVLGNLQYLPMPDNRRKSNLFAVDAAALN